MATARTVTPHRFRTRQSLQDVIRLCLLHDRLPVDVEGFGAGNAWPFRVITSADTPLLKSAAVHNIE